MQYNVIETYLEHDWPKLLIKESNLWYPIESECLYVTRIYSTPVPHIQFNSLTARRTEVSPFTEISSVDEKSLSKVMLCPEKRRKKEFGP